MFTGFYIWEQLHSPEREMKAAMHKSMTEAIKGVGKDKAGDGKLPPVPGDSMLPPLMPPPGK